MLITKLAWCCKLRRHPGRSNDYIRVQTTLCIFDNSSRPRCKVESWLSHSHLYVCWWGLVLAQKATQVEQITTLCVPFQDKSNSLLFLLYGLMHQAIFDQQWQTLQTLQVTQVEQITALCGVFHDKQFSAVLITLLSNAPQIRTCVRGTVSVLSHTGEA